MILRKHRLITSSPEETLRLGASLGKQLTEGCVVALNGDLGSGKTCFTQGIAKGIGVPPNQYVTSPSFALINEYPGRLPFYHMDFYRMEDISELDEIGFHEIVSLSGVVVIEWAAKFPQALPRERFDCTLSIVNEQKRQFSLTGHGSQAMALVELCLGFYENGLA